MDLLDPKIGRKRREEEGLCKCSKSRVSSWPLHVLYLLLGTHFLQLHPAHYSSVLGLSSYSDTSSRKPSLICLSPFLPLDWGRWLPQVLTVPRVSSMPVLLTLSCKSLRVSVQLDFFVEDYILFLILLSEKEHVLQGVYRMPPYVWKGGEDTAHLLGGWRRSWKYQVLMKRTRKNGSSHPLFTGMQNSTATLEKEFGNFLKIKCTLTRWPRHPTSKYLPKRNENILST